MGDVYRSPERAVERYLEQFPETESAARRLIYDFADMLIGPTSGANALRLAETCMGRADELAHRMKEAAERYLATIAPMKGFECPNCHDGTIEDNGDELVCMGECGATWKKGPGLDPT